MTETHTPGTSLTGNGIGLWWQRCGVWSRLDPAHQRVFFFLIALQWTRLHVVWTKSSGQTQHKDDVVLRDIIDFFTVAQHF